MAILKEKEYSTGINSNPIMVAVNDLDNDKNLDIVIANYRTHSIGIFYEFGNGSFQNEVQFSIGISRPIFVDSTDFNRDTFIDIIVIDYETNSISIFYGNPSTTFTKLFSYSTDYDSYPYSLAVGDLNNDQHLDIAITNYGTKNLHFLFFDENNTIKSQMTTSTDVDSCPTSVVLAHFNSDKLLDIAFTNFGTDEIGTLLNYEKRTFTTQRFYSVNSTSPYSIRISDFNGDNRISLALCDFNNDNRLDAFIINNDTGSVNILAEYFQGFAYPQLFNITYTTSFVVISDMNNDDILDVIILSQSNNTIMICFGSGDGSFANVTWYITGLSPTSLAIADLDNDTNIDVIVSNRDSNDIYIFLGNGNGTLRNLWILSNGSAP
ncbi:unnamed protein product [Adineta ricciae]|uniref:VCBS repeat-containing protein n=1 Tax=Adineta ricciae TaxID=249248 RepID=A0A814QSW8_ADIRI|nr:unnamed protein product [Adineta ricciae]CAF1471420.1 unnamed protein product [Adineta ricciae]